MAYNDSSNSWRCPSCGALNNDGKYCSVCQFPKPAQENKKSFSSHGTIGPESSNNTGKKVRRKKAQVN